MRLGYPAWTAGRETRPTRGIGTLIALAPCKAGWRIECLLPRQGSVCGDKFFATQEGSRVPRLQSLDCQHACESTPS